MSFMLGSPMVFFWNNIFSSLDLFKIFIKNTEKQCLHIPKEFQKKKVIIDLDYQSVTIHNGLDDMEWDLDTLFKEHFPNLHRKSAFLSIYGECEHLLNKLCIIIMKERNLGILLADMNGTGVDRARLYLTKVAKLIINDNELWQIIKNLQFLRNQIAHNSGLVTECNNKKYNNIKNSIPYIRGEKEILIDKGFLDYVLQKFITYFKEIQNGTI